MQPRDVAIVRDVWRYKFLTAPQLLELWWPGGSVRAGQRRLSKLFDAGYLERFRPISGRGSFPWTYQLGAEGHRLLQRHGAIPPGQRYAARGVYDYGHVLHELQLNAWVLAYRRLVRDAMLAWEGETDIDPPTAAKRGHLRLDGDWSVKGLRDVAGMSRAARRGARGRSTPRTASGRFSSSTTGAARRQELHEVPPVRRVPQLVVAGFAVRRFR